MSLAILTPPTCEPLHVNDIRQHVKQDITDDDNLLGLYLTSARNNAEIMIRRPLLVTRYKLKLDAFPTNYADGQYVRYDITVPGYAIELPNPPLVEVESIDYIDTAGNPQTMPSSDYVIDLFDEPARITPIFGKIWPIPRPQIGSVTVTYKAGYVAQAIFDSVADTIQLKNWRTLAVGDMLRLTNSGGALPAGLLDKTDYYVQSVVSSGIYKLAATIGGNAIALADNGTGLNYAGQIGLNSSQGEIPSDILNWLMLRVDTHYSHRGEFANTARGEITPLGYTDNLLTKYRIQ